MMMRHSWCIMTRPRSLCEPSGTPRGRRRAAPSVSLSKESLQVSPLYTKLPLFLCVFHIYIIPDGYRKRCKNTKKFRGTAPWTNAVAPGHPVNVHYVRIVRDFLNIPVAFLSCPCIDGSNFTMLEITHYTRLLNDLNTICYTLDIFWVSYGIIKLIQINLLLVKQR